jgi:hypothetical protein
MPLVTVQEELLRFYCTQLHCFGEEATPRFRRFASFARTSAGLCSCPQRRSLEIMCADAHKYGRQASLRGSAPIRAEQGASPSSTFTLVRTTNYTRSFGTGGSKKPNDPWRRSQK